MQFLGNQDRRFAFYMESNPNLNPVTGELKRHWLAVFAARHFIGFCTPVILLLAMSAFYSCYDSYDNPDANEIVTPVCVSYPLVVRPGSEVFVDIAVRHVGFIGKVSVAGSQRQFLVEYQEGLNSGSDPSVYDFATMIHRVSLGTASPGLYSLSIARHARQPLTLNFTLAAESTATQFEVKSTGFCCLPDEQDTLDLQLYPGYGTVVLDRTVRMIRNGPADFSTTFMPSMDTIQFRIVPNCTQFHGNFYMSTLDPVRRVDAIACFN